MKTKHLTKISIGCLLCLVYYGCQEDLSEPILEVEQIIVDDSATPNLFHGTIEDFPGLSQLLKATVEDKKESLKKSATSSREESIYDFQVDLDLVNQVSFGKDLFYTFSVTREQPQDGLLENLVIVDKDGQDSKAYLMRYYPDQEYLERFIDDSLAEFTGQRSLIPLEQELISFSGRGESCHQVTEVRCAYEGHQRTPGDDTLSGDLAGPGCTQTYTVTYDVCISTGDGNGGGGPGGDSTSGPTGNEGTPNGGGTGSGSSDGGDNGNTPEPDAEITPDLMTSPIMDVTLEDLRKKRDCATLNNLAMSSNFQERIQELQAQTTSNTEIGYWGRGIVQGAVPTFSTFDRFEGDEGVVGVEVALPITPVDSFMHNHFNNGGGTLSIFSGSDLVVAYQLYVNNKIADPSNFTMFVVTPGNNVNATDDDTLYALTITDEELFSTTGANLLVDAGLIDNVFRDTRNLVNENLSSQVNENNFAKILANRNLGMTLYRGNSKDLNDWTQISFRRNETIRESPCN